MASDGVMPVPAEMNRYLSSPRIGIVNIPAGPRARIRMPGRRWSSIQRVPMLPAGALTVIPIVSGREGEDEMV